MSRNISVNTSTSSFSASFGAKIPQLSKPPTPRARASPRSFDQSRSDAPSKLSLERKLSLDRPSKVAEHYPPIPELKLTGIMYEGVRLGPSIGAKKTLAEGRRRFRSTSLSTGIPDRQMRPRLSRGSTLDEIANLVPKDESLGSKFLESLAGTGGTRSPNFYHTESMDSTGRFSLDVKRQQDPRQNLQIKHLVRALGESPSMRRKPFLFEEPGQFKVIHRRSTRRLGCNRRSFASVKFALLLAVVFIPFSPFAIVASLTLGVAWLACDRRRGWVQIVQALLGFFLSLQATCSLVVAVGVSISHALHRYPLDFVPRDAPLVPLFYAYSGLASYIAVVLLLSSIIAVEREQSPASDQRSLFSRPIFSWMSKTARTAAENDVEEEVDDSFNSPMARSMDEGGTKDGLSSSGESEFYDLKGHLDERRKICKQQDGEGSRGFIPILPTERANLGHAVQENMTTQLYLYRDRIRDAIDDSIRAGPEWVLKGFIVPALVALAHALVYGIVNAWHGHPFSPAPFLGPGMVYLLCAVSNFIGTFIIMVILCQALQRLKYLTHFHSTFQDIAMNGLYRSETGSTQWSSFYRVGIWNSEELTLWLALRVQYLQMVDEVLAVVSPVFAFAFAGIGILVIFAFFALLVDSTVLGQSSVLLYTLVIDIAALITYLLSLTSVGIALSKTPAESRRFLARRMDMLSEERISASNYLLQMRSHSVSDLSKGRQRKLRALSHQVEELTSFLDLLQVVLSSMREESPIAILGIELNQDFQVKLIGLAITGLVGATLRLSP